MLALEIPKQHFLNKMKYIIIELYKYFLIIIELYKYFF